MADLEIKLTQAVRRAREARASPEVRDLLDHEPAAIDALIEARVTDLSSAKAVLKSLAKSLAALRRVED